MKKRFWLIEFVRKDGKAYTRRRFSDSCYIRRALVTELVRDKRARGTDCRELALIEEKESA